MRKTNESINVGQLIGFNGLVYLGSKEAARADFLKNGLDSEMLFSLKELEACDQAIFFVKKEGYQDSSINAWKWVYTFQNPKGVVEVTILDLPHEQEALRKIENLLQGGE